MNTIDRCSGLLIRSQDLMFSGMRKLIVIVERHSPLHDNKAIGPLHVLASHQ